MGLVVASPHVRGAPAPSTAHLHATAVAGVVGIAAHALQMRGVVSWLAGGERIPTALSGDGTNHAPAQPRNQYEHQRVTHIVIVVAYRPASSPRWRTVSA